MPLLLIYLLIELHVSNFAMLLGIMSGAVSSGLGYSIWYYALNGLTAVQAGVVQLLVPVIAAIGGLLWIGEAITIELIIAQIVMFSPNKT